MSKYNNSIKNKFTQSSLCWHNVLEFLGVLQRDLYWLRFREPMFHK